MSAIASRPPGRNAAAAASKTAALSGERLTTPFEHPAQLERLVSERELREIELRVGDRRALLDRRDLLLCIREHGRRELAAAPRVRVQRRRLAFELSEALP